MGSLCSCCSQDEQVDPYIRYDQANDFTNEKCDEEYKASIGDAAEEFWAKQAKELTWEKEPESICEKGGDATTAKWFSDGEMNIVYNCLDRHVDAELGDEMLFLYSSPQSKITAKLDYDQVCANTGKVANVFKNHFGIQQGDHVFFYAPTIPMVLCLMLSCARMGAVHNACFGGVGAEQLALRLDEAKPKLIVVVSGGFEPICKEEKTEEEPFKVFKYVPVLEEALSKCKNVGKDVKRIIYQRREFGGKLADDDVDAEVYENYKDLCEDDELDEDDCDMVPSTHPLYVTYTSGASGPPIGVVRDHGATAVALNYAMKQVFNIDRESVQFAACHQAWSVGLDFILYGPLLRGCKTVVWEGDPLYPDPFIIWTICEQNAVTNLYINISTLREIRCEDYEGLGIEEADLSALKTVCLVGERGDPDTINWLHERLPDVIINDTYFCTELCWPISGQLLDLETYETVYPTLPGTVTRSVPGFEVRILDADGKECEQAEAPEGSPTSTQTPIGQVAIKRPLPPGCYSSFWGERAEKRGTEVYFKYEGYFLTGDMGYIDENGYLKVVGRKEDVITLASGEEIYPSKVEDSIYERKEVAECAVVPFDSKNRGQVPMAFVVLRGCPADEKEMELAKPQSEKDEEKKQAHRQIRKNVNTDCGEEARLVGCIFVPDLPKTRSGQIMRNVLRAIVKGEDGECAYAACGDAISHIKTAFEAWSEPEDESALSEKEGKNRGCC